MANNFKIRFTGLCGFVPQNPIGPEDNRVRVLLVDAMGSGGHHGTHEHEHHEPVLAIPTAAIAHGPEIRRPEGTFEILNSNIALYLLAREDLFIGSGEPPISETKLSIDSTEVDDSCPDSDTARSFRWVAPMSEIAPSSGSPKQAFLRRLFNSAMGARVLLTRGHLYNAGFARNRNGQIIKWSFIARNGGTSPLERAISEEVEYALDVGDDHLDLTTSSVAGVDRTIRISFEDSNEVVAYVVNMPFPDILRRRDDPMNRVHHFEHLYDLCRDALRPEDRPIPDNTLGRTCCPVDDPSPDVLEVAYARAKGIPLDTVSHPKCPPTLLLPDSSV